jgi:PST family polysaccharide transporter
MSEDAREDLNAAVVRGVRWTAVSRPIIEIVLLGAMVVLARLIGPAEYGRTAVALAVSELAILVPTQGVVTALVQRRDVDRGHLQAGHALAIGSSIVLAGLTLLLSHLVVTPIFGGRTALFVDLVTPGFVLAGLSAVPIAMLTRELEFGSLSVIDIVNTITRSAVSVTLAVIGLGGASLLLGGLAGASIALVIAWIKSPPPLPVLRRQPARDILSYGFPAAIASISWVGFRNCDYAVVGARLGAAQAGFYFRAYTLAVEYQKKVSLVIGQVGFPVLARSEDAEHMAQLRLNMVRLLTVTLFPCLTLLAITAPVLVPWLFGSEWSAAVHPTQVLALGGASSLVIDAVGAVLMASRRPRALLVYGWAHFVVYIGGVVLISPLGLDAVAITAAVVHTIFLVAAYQLITPGRIVPAVRSLLTDTGPALGSAAVLAAAAVPMSLALRAAHVPAFPQLVAVSAVGGVAYLLALRILFPATWATIARFARRVMPDRGLPLIGRRLQPVAER